MCGPYKEDELPWVSVRGGELFLDAKIAPVSIVIKGDVVNGRVIVDGSFPHAMGEVDVNGQVGQCRHQCGLPSANRWDGAHP